VEHTWGTTTQAVLSAYPTSAALAAADSGILIDRIREASHGRWECRDNHAVTNGGSTVVGRADGRDAAGLSMRLLMEPMAFLAWPIQALDERLAAVIPQDTPILTSDGPWPDPGGRHFGRNRRYDALCQRQDTERLRRLGCPGAPKPRVPADVDPHLQTRFSALASGPVPNRFRPLNRPRRRISQQVNRVSRNALHHAAHHVVEFCVTRELIVLCVGDLDTINPKSGSVCRSR
jgi:hypothetical protein